MPIPNITVTGHEIVSEYLRTVQPAADHEQLTSTIANRNTVTYWLYWEPTSWSYYAAPVFETAGALGYYIGAINRNEPYVVRPLYVRSRIRVAVGENIFCLLGNMFGDKMDEVDG